jgi:hypothetical protein
VPFITTHLILPAFIGSSPLFARASLPNSWLFRFGAPRLEPAKLADAIVKLVESGQSGVLSLPLCVLSLCQCDFFLFERATDGPGFPLLPHNPSFVNLVPLVRLLPSLLREFAQALAGADRAMDGFALTRSMSTSPSPSASSFDTDDP